MAKLEITVLYYTVMILMISAVVGFPIIIWRTIRATPAELRMRKLSRVFRLFVLGGCLVAGAIYLALSLIGKKNTGPTPFGVMHASQDYLENKYGWHCNWSFSVGSTVITATIPPAGYYIVDYGCDTRRGVLKASYSDYERNKKFTFEEQ